VYRDQKRWDEAIACFREAVKLDPELAAAHLDLGLALHDGKNKPKSAVRAFRRALALDENNTDAAIALGNALRAAGDPDGAEDAYRQAVDKDPQSALAHNNLGNLLRDRGDPEEAAACFQRAVAIEPGNAEFQLNLAGALDLRKEWPAALRAVLASLATDPDSLKARGLLVVILGRVDQPAALVRPFDAAWAKNPAWADGRRHSYRYGAATFAARAATGGATVPVSPSDAATLRTAARDWLTAELAAWQKYLAADPAKRAGVRSFLRSWLADVDLAGMRHPMAIGFLPAAERDAWRKLWADVRELREQTAAK
jgi:tetratricopeptide (TPR) repeat protein